MSTNSSPENSRGFRSSRRPNFGLRRGQILPSRGRGILRASQEPSTETPQPPYGPLLLELKQEELSKSTKEPKITDCSYVASYSWLDKKNPTIIIPGQPPAWMPPISNRKLSPDQGDFFRDQNAARFPAFPMEPAVQAVLKQNPKFAAETIDIFMCASSLGNLSRFTRGVMKDFRIMVEMVGNTLFFIRRERSPRELIPDVKGYGHTFPNEYTSWSQDVKGSESHQRVIQYTLGGLRLLVRFEADGYFPKETQLENPVAEKSQHSEKSPHSLLDLFGDASIAPSTGNTEAELKVEEGGQSVAQSDLFDIKTRSQFDFKTRTIKKEIDLTDILPKLWMSQIPTLLVGFHDRGLFDDIRKQDMRKEIAKWEAASENNIRQLISLLHELVEFAGGYRNCLELCRSGSGPLEIRRLAEEGFGAIPSTLKALWTGEENTEGCRLLDGGPARNDNDREELNSDDG